MTTLTPYEQFQLEKYGNILNEGDTAHMVDDDPDQRKQEDTERRIAELVLLDQMIHEVYL